MNKTDEKILNSYIIENQLIDSYIDKKLLYRCRPHIPERMIVGVDNNGNKIFFEETLSSLQRKKWKNSHEVKNWNLLYYDGSETRLLTSEYLQCITIDFETDDFNIDVLKDFLTKKNHRNNPFCQRIKGKKRAIYLNDEDYEIVKEFVNKLRTMRKAEKHEDY